MPHHKPYKVDYRFEHHGSIFLVHPRTVGLRRELRSRVGVDTQWLGGALAVEPRYAETLKSGLESEGFVCGS